jgi:Ca2+-binding EF-hand superfamily protein
MWLNMTARDLGEPPHKTLVQLTALRRLLGPAAERHAAADALKRFASADDEKDGSLTLAQFRAALRGDSVESDDVGGGADDARALFNLLRKDADSVDFFAFLVGVALLEAGGVGSGASGALELVFGLLDADGTGLVPRSRAGQDKRAKFPTSKAHISAVFHSFRLIFGRAIISRNGLAAWMLFPERARAEHSR